MDIIQLLPDSVANQIAAGEVIQRPASVIKELVENAIDAGAKVIKVLVVDAGRTSIQVIDDGCGMSETDARLAFERHATSKIRQADDLFSLHTMGFRGEALASIAAVAQVTLQTRQVETELGTRLNINGSHIVAQEPVVCPVGSNFLVENIFYNVPARRKFLKSNSTEMSNINQAFERIALVYPEIAFILYNNGQEALNLRATSLRQRILDVFGKRLNQVLLPVETNTTLCRIRGFVGKPESSRKKRCEQFFFVNGRYMKHAYFHKAIMEVYERLVPAGEQVPYFVYFDVDPEKIDVNIHPVKTEIKFEDERDIWQILVAAVRDSIGKFTKITSLDFDTEGCPDIPVFDPNNSENVIPPSLTCDPSYNPFETETKRQNDVCLDILPAPKYLEGKNSRKKTEFSSLGLPKGTAGIDDWKTLYDDISSAARRERDNDFTADLFPSAINEARDECEFIERSHEHVQYRGMYIVTQFSNGLMFVDQHRADVRILYENYQKTLASHVSHTQKLIFPENIHFPPSYTPLLDSIIEEMCGLGFEIKKLESGDYSVSGIPVGLSGLDAVTLVSELVDAAIEYGSDVSEKINSILALGLAQRVATPYGEVLAQDDMESIIERLLQCENCRYTPDGKTIIGIIEHSLIEHLF